MNAPAIPAQPMPKRILVVDDEPPVAETIRAFFESDGYAVDLAFDAGEGLGKFEVGKYCLVTTDCQMPHMNGLQLARAIKARCPGQPVVMISGSVNPKECQPTAAGEINAMVRKPFTWSELRDAVALALGSP